MNGTNYRKQFVLKCIHDSGTIVLCTDLAASGYCYKNIRPRIIREQLLSENGTTPHDYKFFFFHGVTQLKQVDTGRFTDHGRLTLFPNFEPAPFHIDPQYLRPDQSIKKAVEKQANLEEMMELSRILSKSFKFIRVDFYSINNKIYFGGFGELTFYQTAGYENIYPYSYNDWLGDLLDLNKN